jgi:hypothetical protein
LKFQTRIKTKSSKDAKSLKSFKFWILPTTLVRNKSTIVFQMPVDVALSPTQWHELTLPYQHLLDDYSLVEIQNAVDDRIVRVVEQVQLRIIDIAMALGGRQVTAIDAGATTVIRTADDVERLFGIPSYNERLLYQIPDSTPLQTSFIMSTSMSPTAPTTETIYTVLPFLKEDQKRKMSSLVFLLTVWTRKVAGKTVATKTVIETQKSTVLQMFICDRYQLGRRFYLWMKNDDNGKRRATLLIDKIIKNFFEFPSPSTWITRHNYCFTQFIHPANNRRMVLMYNNRISNTSPFMFSLDWFMALPWRTTVVSPESIGMFIDHYESSNAVSPSLSDLNLVMIRYDTR